MPSPVPRGVEDPAVRLGMRLVKGVSHANVQGISEARHEGPFTSVGDLARRSGASPSTLARLAAADAMRSLGLNRREALWQVLALSDDPPMLAEIGPAVGTTSEESTPTLPQLSLEDVVMADYRTIGLSLTAHPMSLVRQELAKLGVQQNRVLRNARQGEWIRVAGVVLVRQRPSTARGITFCTLEDETATANLVIRPLVYEKFRQAAHGAVALIVSGRVERLPQSPPCQEGDGGVVHVQVRHLEDLSRALSELCSLSRDFR